MGVTRGGVGVPPKGRGAPKRIGGTLKGARVPQKGAGVPHGGIGVPQKSQGAPKGIGGVPKGLECPIEVLGCLQRVGVPLGVLGYPKRVRVPQMELEVPPKGRGAPWRYWGAPKGPGCPMEVLGYPKGPGCPSRGCAHCRLPAGFLLSGLTLLLLSSLLNALLGSVWLFTVGSPSPHLPGPPRAAVPQ